LNDHTRIIDLFERIISMIAERNYKLVV
jgi:hypothetical protein